MNFKTMGLSRPSLRRKESGKGVEVLKMPEIRSGMIRLKRCRKRFLFSWHPLAANQVNIGKLFRSSEALLGKVHRVRCHADPF